MAVETKTSVMASRFQWRRQMLLVLLLTSMIHCSLGTGSISSPISSKFALALGARLDEQVKKLSSRPSLTSFLSRRQSTAVSTLSTPLTTTTTTARVVSDISSSSSAYATQSRWMAIRSGAAAAKRKVMTARQMELFNLLSGGAAGTIASTITNPLEVVKTQLQSSNQGALLESAGGNKVMAVSRAIMTADGVAGFWRGLPATLFGIIPSRSVYFYSYQRSKKALGPYLKEGSPPNAMIAGFMAGIAGNTITNPIWMVRTRMQLLADAASGQKAYSSYFDAVVTIFREEGLKGFYKGVAASYWGCTEGAIQFLMYEQFKDNLLKRTNARRASEGLSPVDHLSEMTLFFSAAFSKMVASIATYPHEVARTRMREQAKMGLFKYKGMWQTLSLIAKEEGTGAMYAGMGVHLLKVVPNSALMFLTYELVRKWLAEFEIVD